MKKITEKQRWWFKRRQVKINIRRRRKKRSDLDIGYKILLPDNVRNLVKGKVVDIDREGSALRINLPKRMNFLEAYDETIAPILAMRECIEKNVSKARVSLKYINLDNIESMCSGQVSPDTKLSFFSAFTGDTPPLC